MLRGLSKIRPIDTLAVAFALAVGALVGCGGDDSGSDDATAQDRAALKALMLNEAATDTSEEECGLLSSRLLATLGGREACVRDRTASPQTITVDRVDVNGDSANILFTRIPEDQQFSMAAVREGGPTDSYDGWRIDADYSELQPVGTQTQTAAQSTTSDATTAELATPQGTAAAYLTCIEGRGAKGVKQLGLEGKSDVLPSVDFSGGGSRVNAGFGTSEADAEQGLATVRQRKPFFAERFGTIVLYSVGDPLADDLETGLACAKEVG
jgi:hypothetical protein